MRYNGGCERCGKKGDTHAIYVSIAPNFEATGNHPFSKPYCCAHLCVDCLKQFYVWADIDRAVKN